jgi:hypothetical protein
VDVGTKTKDGAAPVDLKPGVMVRIDSTVTDTQAG